MKQLSLKLISCLIRNCTIDALFKNNFTSYQKKVVQDPHPRIHGDSYPDDASQKVESVKKDEDYRTDK